MHATQRNARIDQKPILAYALASQRNTRRKTLRHIVNQPLGSEPPPPCVSVHVHVRMFRYLIHYSIASVWYVYIFYMYVCTVGTCTCTYMYNILLYSASTCICMFLISCTVVQYYTIIDICVLYMYVCVIHCSILHLDTYMYIHVRNIHVQYRSDARYKANMFLPSLFVSFYKPI